MADTTSFYDIGGYRENVRRYKEGIEQLTDIQTMIKVPFFVSFPSLVHFLSSFSCFNIFIF